jgi:DNA invertase Pin-like site-specific DNA recombinase
MLTACAHKFNEEGRVMTKAPRRAAIYVRVSTDHQAVNNQTRDLRQIAEQRGWTVVGVYSDADISGVKGPDKHPGLDSMLMHAGQRTFDVVMACAIDQLGCSLIDLLISIQHLEATGVDLYLDQQNLDTTIPTGKTLFQVSDAFAEFERKMIRRRVRVGLGPVNESRPERQVCFHEREGASAP